MRIGQPSLDLSMGPPLQVEVSFDKVIGNSGEEFVLQENQRMSAVGSKNGLVLYELSRETRKLVKDKVFEGKPFPLQVEWGTSPVETARGECSLDLLNYGRGCDVQRRHPHLLPVVVPECNAETPLNISVDLPLSARGAPMFRPQGSNEEETLLLAGVLADGEWQRFSGLEELVEELEKEIDTRRFTQFFLPQTLNNALLCGARDWLLNNWASSFMLSLVIELEVHENNARGFKREPEAANTNREDSGN